MMVFLSKDIKSEGGKMISNILFIMGMGFLVFYICTKRKPRDDQTLLCKKDVFLLIATACIVSNLLIVIASTN